MGNQGNIKNVQMILHKLRIYSESKEGNRHVFPNNGQSLFTLKKERGGGRERDDIYCMRRRRGYTVSRASTEDLC
jgi:hypothetical protein